MTRQTPFVRSNTSPTYSSASSSCSSSSTAKPSPSPPASNSPSPTAAPSTAIHSIVLHTLPLPHLVFDSSLRLHSLNDAARSVFGVTSGHGGPSHGGGDFPPGGADVFFCVTGEMAGSRPGEKIRNELHRLASKQEERERDGAGGVSAVDWGWGEGDRVEMKSGRIAGLRWAVEAKVTRFVPPSPTSGETGFASALKGGKGSCAHEEHEEDLPEWLRRRDTVVPQSPSAAWFSVLLLRPWRDRPLSIRPAHEKLLTHRRSFSLDAPQQPVLPIPSPSQLPTSPSVATPSPSFASFAFPPIQNGTHSAAPSPARPSGPASNGGGPHLRRKESYSERTPTLGSAVSGNPFALSSLAQRRESLGALREKENGGATASPAPVVSGSAGGWELSKPFGAPRLAEEEEEHEGAEAAAEEQPDSLQPPLLDRGLHRKSSLEGAPSDPTAWPVVSHGPGPTPPPATAALDFASSSAQVTTATPTFPAADPSSPSRSKALRLPQSVFAAAAAAISPRTATGVRSCGSGPGSAGSAGSTNSGSSSGGNSAQSTLSLHSSATATTNGTSPSRRGSSSIASSMVGMPLLPAGLQGIGISVSSAGIQLSQSSPAVSSPPTSGSVPPLSQPRTPALEDVATPTTTSASVRTPTLTTPIAAAPPHPFSSFRSPPLNLSLPRPPIHPSPLSFSRGPHSAGSSSAGSSSPSTSSQPPLMSPRPTALPPLPHKLPPSPPSMATLLSYAAIANLPNTGIILADTDISRGYVNALARELLMGVPASDGIVPKEGGATSGQGAAKDDWWTMGEWSVDDEPWSSMSASTHVSSNSSQPFFSPSSDIRANPFDAPEQLTFSSIIQSGEAISVERGKGTAGSGLRIGRAAESNRFRTSVSQILARSLVSDERRRAAFGKNGPPSGSSISSTSTTANQTPAFVAAGGVGAAGKKCYKVFDHSFSRRIVDPVEPMLEMAARRGEEPPPLSSEDSDEDEEAMAGGAVLNQMCIGVEVEVWEATDPSSAAPPGSSNLRNESFVSSTSSGAGLFTGRKKRVRRRIVELTAMPLHAPRADGSKQHLGGMLLLRDVTNDRKRWEAADRSSRRKKAATSDHRYRLILDSLPQMVWTTTPLGSHNYFNGMWYQYTGLEPEQSLGLGWQSPFHEDDMPSCLKAWAHSLETGEPYAVEYRCRRYDGEWRWMLGRALPFRDADGTIQGWFGTCTDFHELYHMREQLRSTLQQNAAVLAGASCLLIAVDLNERITFYEGADKTKMLEDEGIEGPPEGMSISAFDPPPEFHAAIRRVLSGEASDGSVQDLFRLGRTFRCLLTPLTQTRVDGSSVTTGCIVVAHDISDLVRAQKELEASYEERAKLQASETAASESSRLKSEFLSHASHELRTPIAHMLGLSELLLAEPLGESQRNLAAQILRSGDVLLELVGQVLDMGKVEAGKLDLENRPFDLNDLSSDARLFSSAAAKKGLDFIEDIDVFNTQVFGDKGRLRQVLTNILSNACKFTKQGAVKLRIKQVAEDDDSITVQWQVQDTGVGIREEAISSLFQPFHQADVQISRQFGGTGLGLSISKNLIELMGGEIELESEFGQGTTMTATLKMQKVPQEVPPSTPDPAEAVDHQSQEIDREQVTILVVDDNELNRSIMNFQVETASSGYEALELVDKKRYQLILMDHQMDGLDGLETTIRIRRSSNPLVAGIKIIALTASALKGDEEAFMANGADGYLSKPVRSAVLESSIIRALQPAIARRPSVTTPSTESSQRTSRESSLRTSGIASSGSADPSRHRQSGRPTHEQQA
ncbi:hypothetical protein JCM10213_008521 [Rhodosporidiobolus nylandii]